MQYGAVWHDVHSKLEEVQQRADDTNLANRYQWDKVFTDGGFYKQGVGGQGLYVSRGATW